MCNVVYYVALWRETIERSGVCCSVVTEGIPHHVISKHSNLTGEVTNLYGHISAAPAIIEIKLSYNE